MREEKLLPSTICYQPDYLANETLQTNLVSYPFILSIYANFIFLSFLFFVCFSPMNGQSVNYQMFQLTKFTLFRNVSVRDLAKVNYLDAGDKDGSVLKEHLLLLQRN